MLHPARFLLIAAALVPLALRAEDRLPPVLPAVEDARREDPADDVDLVPIDADAEKETSPAPVATPPRDIQAAAPTAIERATQVSSSRPPVHPVVEQVLDVPGGVDQPPGPAAGEHQPLDLQPVGQCLEHLALPPQDL